MMQPYVTTITLDEKREVTIQLPDDMPTGEVRITVEPVVASETEASPESVTREWVQAKLKAAGLLADISDIPESEELSEEEEEKLAHQMAGGRPAEDLVNDDREERF